MPMGVSEIEEVRVILALPSEISEGLNSVFKAKIVCHFFQTSFLGHHFTYLLLVFFPMKNADWFPYRIWYFNVKAHFVVQWCIMYYTDLITSITNLIRQYRLYIHYKTIRASDTRSVLFRFFHVGHICAEFKTMQEMSHQPKLLYI